MAACATLLTACTVFFDTGTDEAFVDDTNPPDSGVDVGTTSDAAHDTTDVSDVGATDTSPDPEPDGAPFVNGCGGDTPLRWDGDAVEPAEPCGPCDDGQIVCDGRDAVDCVGASEVNACGGCGELDATPGAECGDCGDGRWRCDAGELTCSGSDVAWYPDGDSDGFGDASAEPTLSCDRPDGHRDNALDCDDGDEFVRPGAEDTCDDVDNDCDGFTDRFCLERCAGTWPATAGDGTRSVTAYTADFDQDGRREVVLVHEGEGAIFDATGRARATDLPMTVWGGIITDVLAEPAGAYRLEWLGLSERDGSVDDPYLQLVTLGGDGARVVPLATDQAFYFNSRIVARDVDRDGSLDVLVNSSDFVHRATIGPAGQIAISDGVRPAGRGTIFRNRLAWADTDGDDQLEAVVPTGSYHYYANQSGEIEVMEATEDGGLASACDACPLVTVPGRVSEGNHSTLVHDIDGDGVDELVVNTLVDAADDGVGTEYRTVFGLQSGLPTEAGPGLAPTALCGGQDVCVPIDVGDGTTVCPEFECWLADIDGDGDQDRVAIDGNAARVLTYDAGVWTPQQLLPLPVWNATRVEALADLDGDGTLEVLVETSPGSVDCLTLPDSGYDAIGSFGAWNLRLEPTRQADNWEPNDRAAHAARIIDRRGLVRGFVPHSGDEDWFVVDETRCLPVEIRAPSGAALSASLLHAPTLVTLTPVDSVELGPGETAELSCADADAGGEFLLRVRPRGPTTTTGWYAFRLSSD